MEAKDPIDGFSLVVGYPFEGIVDVNTPDDEHFAVLFDVTDAPADKVAAAR
jgi:hypothetical protein